MPPRSSTPPAAKTSTPEDAPPRERVMLDDEPGDNAVVEQAERQREAAYDASYQWRGVALQPFTIVLESVYLRLRPLLGDLPLEVSLRHPETFLAEALVILYLCHPETPGWQDVGHDLPALLERVRVWAPGHVPRHMASDAVELVIRLLNDSHATEAVPRPSTRGEGQVGN